MGEGKIIKIYENKTFNKKKEELSEKGEALIID